MKKIFFITCFFFVSIFCYPMCGFAVTPSVCSMRCMIPYTEIIINITSAQDIWMRYISPTNTVTEMIVNITSARDIWIRYEIAYIYCYWNHWKHYYCKGYLNAIWNWLHVLVRKSLWTLLVQGISKCNMKLPTYTVTEIIVNIASARDIWMRYEIAYIYCYGDHCKHYWCKGYLNVVKNCLHIVIWNDCKHY